MDRHNTRFSSFEYGSKATKVGLGAPVESSSCSSVIYFLFKCDIYIYICSLQSHCGKVGETHLVDPSI